MLNNFFTVEFRAKLLLQWYMKPYIRNPKMYPYLTVDLYFKVTMLILDLKCILLSVEMKVKLFILHE
jgi:hypothetical protein